MTRTFCVGEPPATLREWYDLTERALDAALDAVEPGATGEDVHAAACEVYGTRASRRSGPTPRRRPDLSTPPATGSASTSTSPRGSRAAARSWSPAT